MRSIGDAINLIGVRRISGRGPAVAVHVMPDEHRETAQHLREQAARCRRLAAAITDAATSRRLLELAIELEGADAKEGCEHES